MHNFRQPHPIAKLCRGSPLRIGGRRLTTGPADFDDFVLDFAVISTQNSRDLLYRQAAHKHIPQLGQLRIGPFAANAHGWRLVPNLGAPQIDDRVANQVEQRFLFGMPWTAQEVADFDIRNLTADDAFA